MTEWVTYGSVGGVGRKPDPYPAADAGRPSRLLSAAAGSARLHFALDYMKHVIVIVAVFAAVALGIFIGFIEVGTLNMSSRDGVGHLLYWLAALPTSPWAIVVVFGVLFALFGVVRLVVGRGGSDSDHSARSSDRPPDE